MKQIKLILFVAVMSLSAVSVMNAQDQSSKIAHISTQKLVEKMPQYQSAQSQLEKLEKTYSSDIQDMMKEAKKKSKQYKSEAQTTTDEENMQRSKDLRSTQQKIMKYRQNAQKKLQEKESKLIQPIVDKARKAIQRVAKEKGFDYVLDSSEGGSNVLMADGYNLMPDVKKELDL